MQLECSDQSLACSVGLQSTPSSVIRAAFEGCEMLSAADTYVAVEDRGDTCSIPTWAASASDVCAGSACRPAHGDGQVRLRAHPPSFSVYAREPGLHSGPRTRGFRHRAQRAERLVSQSSPLVYGAPGSRTRKPVRRSQHVNQRLIRRRGFDG
jgi:hypothetical protein